MILEILIGYYDENAGEIKYISPRQGDAPSVILPILETSYSDMETIKPMVDGKMFTKLVEPEKLEYIYADQDRQFKVEPETMVDIYIEYGRDWYADYIFLFLEKDVPGSTLKPGWNVIDPWKTDPDRTTRS